MNAEGLKFSIILKAFNEEKTIESVVIDLENVLSTLNSPYEILIVDDGSSDGTATIAERLSYERPAVWVIHHQRNRGVGEVIRTGFQNVSGEYVTIFPADGQIPATNAAKFVPLMEDADMALGTIPQLAVGRPFFSRFLSASEKLVYRILFGFSSDFQGIMMFRRSLLESFPLKSKGRGWVIMMELVMRTMKGGYPVITGVETEILPRQEGLSKVNNIPTILSNLVQIFLLRVRF